MKAIKISVVIAGLLLAPVNSGLAEPTVEETKKFITARAKQCKNFTYRTMKFNQNEPYEHMRDSLEWKDFNVQISFINDEVHAKETYHILHTSINTTKEIGTDRNITWDDYHMTVLGIAKLKDLSPVVEVRDTLTFDEKNGNRETGTTSPGFALHCSAGDCWKTEERGDGKEVPDEYENGEVVHGSPGSWLLPTCNLDAAQRMAKAFTHLIKKSGGKEPLF